MEKLPVPVKELGEKVSPIPLIAPPPFGREISDTFILLFSDVNTLLQIKT